MKIPTNKNQKDMALGILRSLYKSRIKQTKYDEAIKIKKEIEKIESLKL
jgi:hypothetical protein